MKIDAEQLNKDIEAIPGVCKEGKDGIRKLFENSFGVKFKYPEKMKVGMVFSTGSMAYLLVQTANGGYELVGLNKNGGSFGRNNCVNITDEGIAYLGDGTGYYKKVANSPKEYFAQKGGA